MEGNFLPILINDKPTFIITDSEPGNPYTNEAKKNFGLAAKAFRPVEGLEGEIAKNIGEARRGLEEGRFELDKTRQIREDILKTAEYKAYSRNEDNKVLWILASFFSYCGSVLSGFAAFDAHKDRE